MSSPTQPTVLVVEDEADLRQLIAESLSADGFEVAQAPDAADAVERLKDFAYDALVVDLRLPDADGMDVLDAALSRYPDILAVMVTGFGGVDRGRVSAMKRGAVDFLIKPFQLAQLSRVLKTGMEQRRLRQENAELRAQLRDRYRFDTVVGQSARDAAGLPDPRAGRADEQHRADSGRDRHRQGADRPDHPPQQPARATSGSSRSTPPRFPSRSPRPSSSATPRARSPAPSPPASAASSWPTAARCSSTKSA